MPKYMGRSQARTSPRYVHIPTEILVQIANLIFDQWTEDLSPDFQSTLHKFCLVSRQWYSAGIGFLYHRPQLAKGNSFALFTNTVCPPIRSRGRKVDLGSLVQVLNLSGLVHHSSNSLTARLLGRVKKSLRKFAAPRVSFSINSLAPLSKCKEMTHLSLGLVADPITLYDLKKAVGHLDKLESLDLPPSMLITDDGSSEDWPPNLKWLKVGGCFDSHTARSFRWPTTLQGLTLIDCEYLTTVLDVASMNEQLCATLKELTISPYHRELLVNEPFAGVKRFSSLRRLRIPIDSLFGVDINPVFDVIDIPRSMRELILTSPIDETFAVVDIEHLCKALRGELSQVCGIGISPDCLGFLPQASRANIDGLVWNNIDNCPEDELDAVFDLGLYVLDPEQVY